jgi:hypothetical protein
MTTAKKKKNRDALLFLFSFIVTYNFTAMQKAFTNIGLTAGFYGVS